jgi:hypothetical protein
MIAMIWRFMLLTVGAVLTTGANAQLLGHVEVATQPNMWAYTVFNDEPLVSTDYIGYFQLEVDAQFDVVGCPDGWVYETDHRSYVMWLNNDIDPPYPHDVAPGASLGGFAIYSTAERSRNLSYAVLSWDHAADLPGPAAGGNIASPSAVPEPSACLLGASMVTVGFATLRRRRHWPQ